MYTITLPRIGTANAWRDEARALIAARVAPEDVLWQFGDDCSDLFADTAPVPRPKTSVTVPKSFASIADTVVWHSDPERFARLYRLLWRLRDSPTLMSDRGDSDLAHLRDMEKAVRRCAHKMKAFVRFREMPSDADRRAFAAWFEPTHHTVEPTAPFFERRFADMDWMIVTPDVTARFDGSLTFHPGQPKPDMPGDATEELWGTYFRNIFNPARLKVQAMTSEMPKKYWKNLPEAQYIPDLIAGAESRVREMRAAAPTLPPLRAEKILARLADTAPDLGNLHRRANEENRALPDGLGHVILGEGPEDADLMIVGERPGDIEDREGRPFVGPAGQLFDRVARSAGLDRATAYVTNAVKQFRYQWRGKRRIHQPPNAGEIRHGKWWLDAERAIVKPRVILAMGRTAAESLTGNGKAILSRRGSVETAADGTPVVLTIHPSYILRLPDGAARATATEHLRQDFLLVNKMLADGPHT